MEKKFEKTKFSGEMIPLALQHIFAMIAGNIFPAILIASTLKLSSEESTMLIQGAMLAAAIATIIQIFPIKLFKNVQIGSGLPLVMGISYVFLGACINVVENFGIAEMIGAQIIGAIFMVPLSFLVKKLNKYFTTLVTGVVVVTMGLGLLSSSINNLAGGQGAPDYGSYKNILVGLLVVFVIIFINHYGKGKIKDISIFIGITTGYIVSLFLGLVDFSQISNSSVVGVPNIFYFGVKYNFSVILTFLVLFMIQVADLIGITSMATSGAYGRSPSEKELQSVILGASAGTMFSSALNIMPTAIYSQNAAIVSINKKTNRNIYIIVSAVLLLSGISPLLGNILTTIPNAVLGGATLVIFSSMITSGIEMLTIDFNDKNKLIAGIAIAFSLGIQMVPEFLSSLPSCLQILFGSNVATAAFTALVLQQLLVSKKED